MSAPWVLAMDWRNALLLHWRADPAALRRAIPADLELDLYAGEAWISIFAFRLERARPRILPPLAALPPFYEINLRTYVRDAERSGVWFFSLDAASALAVWTGRRLGLNYVNAHIEGTWNGAECKFHAERNDRRNPDARFDATATISGPFRTAPPNTLEHWLVERYALFTVLNGPTLRGDVTHEPWPIQDANVTITENTLLSAANITTLDAPPLAQASAGVSTQAYPPRPIAR